MATKHEGLNLVKAVSAFSRKLERFTSANPSAEPAHAMTADEIRQKKIDYYEQDFKLSVVNEYKKFRFPYKTLGAHAPAADAIANDQQQLLAAYNIHKAVVEADTQFRTTDTFAKENLIASPLVQMEQYTMGDSFVYLQCWLFYEQQAKAYVPYFAVQQDGSYQLRFAPLRNFKLGYKEKEVAAVIKTAFYPSETVDIF